MESICNIVIIPTCHTSITVANEVPGKVILVISVCHSVPRGGVPDRNTPLGPGRYNPPGPVWYTPPRDQAGTHPLFSGRYTPPDQEVHPRTRQVHPQTKAGTPPQDQAGLTPGTRQYTPLDQEGTPPGPGTPPMTRQVPPRRSRLRHTVNARRYASYWNAFLFVIIPQVLVSYLLLPPQTKFGAR